MKITPMYAEHVQLRQTRNLLPRAARRLERARPFLKPRDYRRQRANLEQVAKNLPVLCMVACARAQGGTD